VDALNKREVTDVVITQGWVLPQDWSVTAQLYPDEHYSDPREVGDCYACDFAAADHHNPDKGFCEHCDQIITKIGAECACELGLGEVDADIWANLEGSVHCPSAEPVDCPDCDTGKDNHGNRCTRCGGHWAGLPGPHELADPVAVKAWRSNDWSFYGVVIEVRDTCGRVWGQSSLWSIEGGLLPLVHADGRIERRYLDPLQTEDPDSYPVPGLINEALRIAQNGLRQDAEECPVITQAGSE